MRRGVFLVFGLLLLVGAAVWIQANGGGAPDDPAPDVSAEVADSAQAKLDRLARGDETRVGFGENEVQSLLQYKYAGLIPAFVDSPRVEIVDSVIVVRARVPVHDLPAVSELGEAAVFLPDTAEIQVTGKIAPLDSTRVALAISEVTASSIPLPQRLVPGVLRRIGRIDEPGLAADAVALPLPPGASAVYARGDSLIFLSSRAGGT